MLRFYLYHNVNPETSCLQPFSCASPGLRCCTVIHSESQGFGLKMLYINIHFLKGTKAIEKKLSYNGKQQPAPRHPPARRRCPAALRMILGPTGRRRALCLSAPPQWRWQTQETVPKWPRCVGEELMWSGLRLGEWSLKFYFLLEGWEKKSHYFSCLPF